MEEKERREVTDGDEEQLEEIELKETKKQEVLDDIKEDAENVGQALIEVIIRAKENQLNFMRQMAVVGERVARAIAPITQHMENRMQAISSVFDSIGAIGQRIQDTLNNFDYYDRLSNLRELAQRHEEATLKFKTIMIELGFPPHDFMPINITGYVIQLYEEKGIEYTKRFLERYMCMFVYNKETLIEMHNSWQQAEWLEKRLPIISTVIEGHFNGYYMLTVPVILAQIEGVLVEGILKLEAVAPDEQIKYKHQKSFLGQFLLGNKSSFSFDEQIEEFYLNTVLVNFDRGKEIESDLSRHAILHGEDVNYGTKINSLKGILIFDYLFDKLNEAYKDIEKSKLEIKRQKEIAQSKKRARNASGKKSKGYRKKVTAK
ncbi:hypothetical protein [Bacillus pseudomycoides]|uniref:Uncharacterized protein n=1 Tax=Bacillus pseudomycoides TaxID=64104 RepID=A0A2B5HQT6_9BACI|nr:hypothetical protein [Bacillus pseudomycoides]PED72997.1 hypothetical protein CON97_06675 [Bacillus pseudomycoides]PEI45054.1 hypothetical protein CN620_03015 [Bacillus pseudomycoides]PEJ79516.1 hypothetical protein CN680_09235 [Bacillus pseudomycoides]PEM20031.1 hypothetical protein CN628_04510 [Bacillus pseudomycoides]PEM69788.1 hypothetical protein CN613_10300 [Bacillus pseudomycoides]